MVESIMKILTVVVIVVLIVILVPAVAPFVTDRMPNFGDTLGQLIASMWDAFRNMINKIGVSV